MKNILNELALTPAQKKLLAYYREEADKFETEPAHQRLQFPPRPCDSQNCQRLESMGLLIGDLEPATWDSRSGTTVFKRAYRIHPDAREAERRINQPDERK